MGQPIHLYVGTDSATGTDIGPKFVDKSYLIDVYPSLLPSVKGPALWLWGVNNSAQLGDNTMVSKSSPVQTVAGGANWKQAAAGQYHAGAIKVDGTLWLWGVNNSGALGDNSVVPKSSPVQTVAAGTTWKQLSCGAAFSGAIKTDGSLWMWGNDSYGNLGDNSVVSKSSPVQTVAAGTNWAQVACGQNHTAAVKVDGSLWLWGQNQYGQLGDNTIAPKSSPVQTVAAGTNWKQAACGNCVTAVIKTDGTLWTWGFNGDGTAGFSGQLGDGTTTWRSSPVQTVAGGTNWKQVAANGIAGLASAIAAVKTDGTLWLWGPNQYGELGDGTTTPKSSPVQTIAGGTNWKQVSVNPYGIGAIKTDGTLWMWGNNANGKLGDNTNVAKSSPVQTVAAGTTWKQVACGYGFTMAVADYNF